MITPSRHAGGPGASLGRLRWLARPGFRVPWQSVARDHVVPGGRWLSMMSRYLATVVLLEHDLECRDPSRPRHRPGPDERAAEAA